MTEIHEIIVDDSMFNAVIRDTPHIIHQRLGRMAFDLEADIKTNFSTSSPSAPGEPPGVVTGFLRSTIFSVSLGDLEWMVGVGAEYGEHQEYGTRHMAARPFVRPAVERIRTRAPKYFEDLYS